MPSFKFHKKERLTNKKKISELFTSGSSINAYPLRLIYMVRNEPEVPPIQFAFTVPKKSFKKAVDRNSLKRKIKESFRLQKHNITNSISAADKNIFGIFIYIDKEAKDYHSIDKAMNKIIGKLKAKID